MRIISANLNGIRSATTKGLESWLGQHRADCICVQEIKAQLPDIEGRFEVLAGMKGHFHLAEKKGYSGVGVYTRHEPSAVIAVDKANVKQAIIDSGYWPASDFTGLQ